MDTLTAEEFDMLVASNSENEWNANCSKIKAARNGQYPRDWFQKMIVSGVMEKVAAKWGGDADIHIESV